VLIPPGGPAGTILGIQLACCHMIGGIVHTAEPFLQAEGERQHRPILVQAEEWGHEHERLLHLQLPIRRQDKEVHAF
jgi:hypothetical protein